MLSYFADELNYLFMQDDPAVGPCCAKKYFFEHTQTDALPARRKAEIEFSDVAKFSQLAE